MALGAQKEEPEQTTPHAGQLELSQEQDQETVRSEATNHPNISLEGRPTESPQETSRNENITEIRQNIRRIKRELFDRATALDQSQGEQDSAEKKKVEKLYREYRSLKDSLIS
jgi:hypothetical protein